MIKAEVVFDGDYIICNGFKILVSQGDSFEVFGCDELFFNLEEAIAYCLEQKHD